VLCLLFVVCVCVSVVFVVFCLCVVVSCVVVCVVVADDVDLIFIEYLCVAMLLYIREQRMCHCDGGQGRGWGREAVC